MAINLAKGQRLSLEKSGGAQLTRVFMGLGWDAGTKGFLGRRKSVVDAAGPQQKEIARYELSGSGRHYAQVTAKVSRAGAGWAMTAIGATTSGRTVRDLVPAVTPHL